MTDLLDGNPWVSVLNISSFLLYDVQISWDLVRGNCLAFCEIKPITHDYGVQYTEIPHPQKMQFIPTKLCTGWRFDAAEVRMESLCTLDGMGYNLYATQTCFLPFIPQMLVYLKAPHPCGMCEVYASLYIPMEMNYLLHDGDVSRRGMRDGIVFVVRLKFTIYSVLSISDLRHILSMSSLMI